MTNMQYTYADRLKLRFEPVTPEATVENSNNIPGYGIILTRSIEEYPLHRECEA